MCRVNASNASCLLETSVEFTVYNVRVGLNVTFKVLGQRYWVGAVESHEVQSNRVCCTIIGYFGRCIILPLHMFSQLFLQ